MLYYNSEMTLQQIGELYGVTKERIRQIVAKTARMLRCPEWIRLLQIGLSAYHNAKVRLSYEKGYEAGCRETKEQWSERDTSVITEELLHIPIEEMNLSTRTYKCLGRAGIHDLGALLELGSERVKKIRHLGNRCYAEIVDELVNTYHQQRNDWE